MTNLSYFESRYAKVTCKAADVFAFVTDIRNFEQFIPDNSITNWHAEKESCSFSLSLVGTVTVKLSEKEKFSKVVFIGDALKKNDFSLSLHISENAENNADVKVKLSADLNPMMKMLVSKPIGQFLEIIVKEMESFTGWKETREQSLLL